MSPSLFSVYTLSQLAFIAACVPRLAVFLTSLSSSWPLSWSGSQSLFLLSSWYDFPVVFLSCLAAVEVHFGICGSQDVFSYGGSRDLVRCPYAVCLRCPCTHLPVCGTIVSSCCFQFTRCLSMSSVRHASDSFAHVGKSS